MGLRNRDPHTQGVAGLISLAGYTEALIMNETHIRGFPSCRCQSFELASFYAVAKQTQQG